MALGNIDFKSKKISFLPLTICTVFSRVYISRGYSAFIFNEHKLLLIIFGYLRGLISMARPIKNTVDYFPHFIHNGKTRFILESKFGNNGYAFWFKLLEILGETNNHVFDYNNPADWEFLLAKTKVTEQQATDILQTLANVGALDKELLEKKLIWCENFVKNVSDVYKRRKQDIPSKPIIVNNNPVDVNNNPDNDDNKPQSKVKYSKVYIVLLDFWNSFKERGKVNTHSPKGIIWENIKKEIDKLFEKGETEEELKQAIENYFKVISNKKYLFKYAWNMDEFLRRKNGYSVFKGNFEKLHSNYLKKNYQEQEEEKLPGKDFSKMSQEQMRSSLEGG